MANTNAPFGFRSFGHQDGSAPTMGLERKFILSSDANLYFTGDPVANSSASPGYIAPYNGSSLAAIVSGIFAGCEYYSATVQRVVWSPYFPGNVGSSNPVTCWIISDPQMQFLVQASSAGFTATSVGSNANVLTSQSSLGNTANGQSVCVLASSQVGNSGSSYPFRIVDVYSNFAPPGVNGVDNSSAYNVLVVVPNNWARTNLTAVTS